MQRGDWKEAVSPDRVDGKILQDRTFSIDIVGHNALAEGRPCAAQEAKGPAQQRSRTLQQRATFVPLCLPLPRILSAEG